MALVDPDRFLMPPKKRELLKTLSGIFVDPDTGEEVLANTVGDGDEVRDEELLVNENAVNNYDETQGNFFGEEEELDAPDHEIGRADIALKLLEVLGGLGGGIMQQRAIGKANKKQAAAQARANLISALSGGRGGGGVAREIPKLGIGGKLLETLGTVGKAGSGLLAQKRGFERQQFKDALSRHKAETARVRASKKPAQKKPASQMTFRDLLNNAEAIGANLATTHPKATREEITTIIERNVREYIEGFGIEEEKSEIAFDVVVQRMLRGHTKAVDAAVKAAKKGTTADYAFLDKAVKNRHKGWKNSAKLTSGVDATTGKPLAIVSFTDFVTPHLEDITSELTAYSDIWERNEGGEPKLKAFAQNMLVNAIEVSYEDAVIEIKKERKGSTPAPVRYEMVELDNMMAKIDNMEKYLEDAELKGPLFGKLPLISWLTPSSALYDAVTKAFTLELAAIMNRGRPTEKDALAVKELLPDRDEGEELRGKKIAMLKLMVQTKIDNFKDEYKAWDLTGDADRGWQLIEVHDDTGTADPGKKGEGDSLHEDLRGGR